MAMMENPNETVSYYDKVDGLARWLGSSVASAFFASLDSCSCVNVDTDGEDEEAYDRPLMLTNLGSVHMSSFNSNSGNGTIGNVTIYPPAVDKLPV